MLIQLFHDTFISLQKIPVCWKEHGSSNATSTFVTNSDEFLNTFNKTYKINPKSQGSLLVALMHIYMSKINGEISPAFPVKAMKFFIASESMSRMTFDLVSAKLLGPSLHTVQSINYKNCGTAIIHCDTNSIKEQAKNIIIITKEDLTKATRKEDPVVTIAIWFDGTKVLQCLQVYHAHKAIVGGVFLDHFIDVREKTAELLKMLLGPKFSMYEPKK